MTDSDSVSNVQTMLIGDVKQAPVLNISVAADVDAIDVGADNRVKPDAGAFSDMGTTDNDCRGGNENTFVHFWLKILKWKKHA
ncbi:MAG: hypothetical protein U0103_20290 [Candidatus Obscuribacterales bacterium]